MPTVVLQRFFSVMLTWKAMLQGALPREVVQTTCDCIKDILRVRDKLQGLSRQEGTAYRLIPLTPSKVTGKKRRKEEAHAHGCKTGRTAGAHTDQSLGSSGSRGKCDGIWGHIHTGSTIRIARNFYIKGGALSAVRVQCARSATIWASGRSRNPYFVVLWASLLFGSRF